MTSARTTAHRALLQAAGLCVAVGVAAAALVVATQQPADAPAVRAEVSVLRSHAAEVELLAEEASGLPTRFVRAQAEQLQRKVESARDRIAGLHVQPDLARAQRHALEAALRLDRTLLGLGTSDPARPEPAAPRAVGAELDDLEEALQSKAATERR